MKLARTAADVLSDHVVFSLDAIDRMLLHVYQPRLQYGGGITGFFKNRGHRYALSNLMQPISQAFVADVHHFIAANNLDLVHFVKGQCKDQVAQEYLQAAAATAGCTVEQVPQQVLFVGRAQEKSWIWRTTKRLNPVTGQSYPWLVKDSVMVNQFYFYLVDDDFGPLWLKFCSYFPYGAKVCLNGNEYAKRQAVKAGIAFTPLDNAFAQIATAEVPRVQAICDGLSGTTGPATIEKMVRKWLRTLPHPFTEQDICQGGYEYEISVLQAEFSTTQMLDRPRSGRIFFEQLLADNLDIGRPDRVSLIFDRDLRRAGYRPTPGIFRTRVLTNPGDKVSPSLHIDYKTSKIKQYYKQGRALRTETTINNPHDFGIGKRLSCLPTLGSTGYAANHRLLTVEQISHDPIDGQTALDTLTQPVITGTGTRIAGLRPFDQRAQALLSALCGFSLLPNGFSNRDLRTRLAGLQNRPTITSGQMTYDLRRLRAHGLIQRIDKTFRYHVTDTGRQTARFFLRVHNRIWRTGLAQITDPDPPWTTALRQADRAYNHAIHELITTAGLQTRPTSKLDSKITSLRA